MSIEDFRLEKAHATSGFHQERFHGVSIYPKHWTASETISDSLVLFSS